MSRGIPDDLLKQWLDTDDEDDIEDQVGHLSFEEVSSSNLAAVAWDGRRRQLTVAFLDGSVYRYRQVPKAVYQSLMSAESHGSYFYWNIRTSYSYERIIG